MIRGPLRDGPGLSDFDRRFEATSRKIDAEFDSTMRYAKFGALFGILISLGTFGFAVWVIVALMRYFGVI